MLSIIEACKLNDFPASISVVLTNVPNAGGITIAQEHDIPTEIVNHNDFNQREQFEASIQECLNNYDVDLIVLAGFMRILTESFIKRWPNKIINIHPSLLPEYKGLNTHQRALNDGKTESGCTVHYVNADLDSGPTICQIHVPITKTDTPETLAARILVQEHKIYPEAIRLIANSYIK